MVDSYMENKDALRNNKLPIKRSVDAKADEMKVEMPDLPHITRPEIVNIPDDILKTFICAIFMGCGSLATAFSIALVHERMPDDPPLPDVILDHMNYRDWD